MLPAWEVRWQSSAFPLIVALPSVCCGSEAAAEIFQAVSGHSMDPGSDVLILVGSQGFSRSPVVAAQLMAVARLRAVESRRTLVRCVNYDSSALIQPDGGVDQIAVGDTPLIADLTLCHSKSLFHSYGMIPAHATWLLLTLLTRYLNGKTNVSIPNRMCS